MNNEDERYYSVVYERYSSDINSNVEYVVKASNILEVIINIASDFFESVNRPPSENIAEVIKDLEEIFDLEEAINGKQDSYCIAGEFRDEISSGGSWNYYNLDIELLDKVKTIKDVLQLRTITISENDLNELDAETIKQVLLMNSPTVVRNVCKPFKELSIKLINYRNENGRLQQ